MSRAEITSEINNLVKQGNMRDAYAKFEELPIIDQIGISLSPGVGDALAVYETGEFGKRAKERFSEGETLKGVGNLAISGLSAASLIPLFRWLRGARGGTRLATNVAEEATDLVKDVTPVKVDPVLQLSPPKPPKPKKVKVKPIPYDKFKPVDDITKLDYAGTRPSGLIDTRFRYPDMQKGLVSGVRKVINEENLPSELTLEQWTKKLLGFGNVKKSELQALDFVDELGNPHPKAVDYFSDLLGTTNRKPTAAINKKGIDNYLAERQRNLFDIRQAPNSQWPSGSKIADGVDHNQKVYRARDILSGEGITGKEKNAHFNPYYDNVAVFDHANNALTDDIARNLERLAGKFDPIDILSDIRINPSFAGDEAAKLVKLSEKLNAEDIVPQQLENFKAGPDAELYSKFIKAHKKLGIPEKKEILDFVEELKALGADDISTQFKQIRRAQSDYAEDIAKGPGYFDMSRFEGRKFNWPSLSERGDDFLNVKDTVARRNSLVKKLMDFDEKTLKADAKTPRVTEQRYKIGKEIAEIDDALLTEAKDSAGDVFLDPNALDTFEVFPDATKRILKTLREDFLSRTPTQRRTLMMRRYDRMQELKDLPFDAKNKLARDVTLLQYMRTALDPRYVKAKKLYPDLLRPDKVVPRAKSVDLPGLDAPYKKDFFAEKGRPKVNSLVLRKNLLDAVAEGKKGIHIDYVQTIEEGGSADVVTAQYREMTKALRKVLQELKVKDEVLEVAVPSTGSFDPEIGKYAFAGRDDIGAGAYYKFTPEFLDAVKKRGINAFNKGGPSDIQESLNELNNYTDAEREAIIKAKNEYEREAAYKKELADLDAYISDNRLVSKEAQMSSMSGEGYKDPRFTVSFDNPIINKFALHPFAGEGSGYQPNTKELGMEGPEELLESSVGGRYYPRTDVVMFKDPYRGITLDRLTELGIDAQKYKGHIKTKEDIQKHELLHRTAHKSGYLDFLPTSEFLKENSTTKYLKGSLAKFLTPLINEALAESYEDIDSGGLQKRIRFRASRFNGLKENKKQEIADEIFENIDVLKQDFENYLESQMNPDELNATQKNAGGLVSIDNMLAQL